MLVAGAILTIGTIWDAVNDPLMGAVGLAEGRQLFDDMVRNTLNYLPEAWRG